MDSGPTDMTDNNTTLPQLGIKTGNMSMSLSAFISN